MECLGDNLQNSESTQPGGHYSHHMVYKIILQILEHEHVVICAMFLGAQWALPL